LLLHFRPEDGFPGVQATCYGWVCGGDVRCLRRFWNWVVLGGFGHLDFSFGGWAVWMH
jgi:hypothetical protein